MPEVIWPLAGTAAAGLLTYLCCVRPMRRHPDPAGAAASDRDAPADPADRDDLDQQLDRVRGELSILRAVEDTRH